jgi:hypothetical protein
MSPAPAQIDAETTVTSKVAFTALRQRVTLNAELAWMRGAEQISTPDGTTSRQTFAVDRNARRK